MQTWSELTLLLAPLLSGAASARPAAANRVRCAYGAPRSAAVRTDAAPGAPSGRLSNSPASAALCKMGRRIVAYKTIAARNQIKHSLFIQLLAVAHLCLGVRLGRRTRFRLLAHFVLQLLDVAGFAAMALHLYRIAGALLARRQRRRRRHRRGRVHQERL